MDIDGDGKAELLSGSWPGEVFLFKRKPNGTFAASEKVNAAGKPIKIGSASAVALADWDADGDLDMMIGNIDGNVFLAVNKGSATKPAFATPEKVSVGGKPIKVDSDAGPCLADWDGDGKIDLIVGSGNGKVEFYRNTGTKQKAELAAPVALVDGAKRDGDAAKDPKQSCTRTKPAVADWNGDGRPDLIVGDFISGGERKYHGWVWVYLRTASGYTAQVAK